MRNRRNRNRAYTLIETLVASAVMMLAVGAAASLSLAMVTQEEMSERTVRAANYLENATLLYQIGIEPADILGILPEEPAVVRLRATSVTEAVDDLGDVDLLEVEMTFSPSAATADNANGTLSWTGGERDVTRTHTIRVFRSSW